MTHASFPPRLNSRKKRKRLLRPRFVTWREGTGARDRSCSLIWPGNFHKSTLLRWASRVIRPGMRRSGKSRHICRIWE